MFGSVLQASGHKFIMNMFFWESRKMRFERDENLKIIYNENFKTFNFD